MADKDRAGHNMPGRAKSKGSAVAAACFLAAVVAIVLSLSGCSILQLTSDRLPGPPPSRQDEPGHRSITEVSRDNQVTVRAEAYELGGELDAEIQFLDGRRMVVQVRMGDSGGVVRFEHEQANGSYSDYQLEHRCESIYGLTDEELMTLEETERYLLVDWYREATDTPYLAARDRRAVYVSLEDDLHKSHCEEDCLAEWQPMEPPYLYCPVDLTHFFLQEVLVGPVTYFTRPDGTVQVALNGKPLYQYSGDSETGELQGCGLDEAWFPINADTGLPVIGC